MTREDTERSAIEGIIEAFRVANNESVGGYWDIEGEDWKSWGWEPPDGWTIVLYEFGDSKTDWAPTGRRVEVSVKAIQ